MAHDRSNAGRGKQSTRGPSAEDILERRSRYASGLRGRRGGVGIPPVIRASLEALLDRIKAPALVLDAERRMVLSNPAARKWRERLGDGEWALFGDAVREVKDPSLLQEYEVTPLASRGAEAWLVIFRRERAGETKERVDAAARRWNLTRRQAEVLELLAQGLSNRAIAQRLGCAARTIEVHVSAIIGKAGLASRTAATAALFSAAGQPDGERPLAAMLVTYAAAE